MSSAEWGVEVFHQEAPATTYTVWWMYPIWREKEGVDEYLMVTYSDQGAVTGIRSYEGGFCDLKCGARIKVGNHKGLDLFVSGKRVILFASREDTARLISTEPQADECVLYLLAPSGNPSILPVYVDGKFVQYGQWQGFFRLVVSPGDHTVTSLIENEWDVDSTPGHPLGETEHRTQSTWAFSCPGGTTLRAVVGLERSSRWRPSTLHCVISSMPEPDATKALSGLRMIIPFDSVQ